jgi:hypothetical protein
LLSLSLSLSDIKSLSCIIYGIICIGLGIKREREKERGNGRQREKRFANVASILRERDEEKQRKI